jgi:hypothetical protein
MNLLEKAKKYKDGIQIIVDWLGKDGVTVDSERAQNRADICNGVKTGDPCFLNYRETALHKNLGEGIKKLVEIKNDAALRVKGEKSLGQCGLCQCHLAAKVWIPRELITSRTTEGDMSLYPDGCWIKKET